MPGGVPKRLDHNLSGLFLATVSDNEVLMV